MFNLTSLSTTICVIIVLINDISENQFDIACKKNGTMNSALHLLYLRIPILALVLSFQKDLIFANCTEKESTASNLGKYETKMTTNMKSYVTSSLSDLAVLNASIP